jgi:hypothetical protein
MSEKSPQTGGSLSEVREAVRKCESAEKGFPPGATPIDYDPELVNIRNVLSAYGYNYLPGPAKVLLQIIRGANLTVATYDIMRLLDHYGALYFVATTPSAVKILTDEVIYPDPKLPTTPPFSYGDD